MEERSIGSIPSGATGSHFMGAGGPVAHPLQGRRRAPEFLYGADP